jgi:hypothetical protein
LRLHFNICPEVKSNDEIVAEIPTNIEKEMEIIKPLLELNKKTNKFSDLEPMSILIQEERKVLGSNHPQKAYYGKQLEKYEKMCKGLLEEGVIRELTSDDLKNVEHFNSPMIRTVGLDKVRFIGNYVEINNYIINSYASVIKGTFEFKRLMNSKRVFFITKLDLRCGYHQIRILKEHQVYTAFTVGVKRYCYKGIPLGLKVALDFFQTSIEKILLELNLDNSWYLHVDDLLLLAESMKELLNITIKVLEKFNSLNLTLNLEKYVFFSQKLKIFGEIFDLKNQTTVISEKKRGNFLS